MYRGRIAVLNGADELFDAPPEAIEGERIWINNVSGPVFVEPRTSSSEC